MFVVNTISEQMSIYVSNLCYSRSLVEYKYNIFLSHITVTNINVEIVCNKDSFPSELFG